MSNNFNELVETIEKLKAQQIVNESVLKYVKKYQDKGRRCFKNANNVLIEHSHHDVITALEQEIDFFKAKTQELTKKVVELTKANAENISVQAK